VFQPGDPYRTTRRAPRRAKRLEAGEIIIAGLRSIPCQVIEVSQDGARIRLSTSPRELPEVVEFRARETEHKAQIARRLGRVLHLVFA
jgi:hypothetical protein